MRGQVDHCGRQEEASLHGQERDAPCSYLTRLDWTGGGEERQALCNESDGRTALSWQG